MIINDIENKLEDILSFYSKKENGQFLTTAKNKYFQMTGTVDHDTHNFEHKMNSFTEWFVLHYSPYRSGEKIYELFERECGLSENIKNELSNIYYSVFDPLGNSSGSKSIIKDCITGTKFILDLNLNPYMVIKGEIFVGRIINSVEGICLLKGIVPLPQDVREFVEKSAKLVNKKKIALMPEEFCLTLEGMKYQCLQYQHIDPQKIFTL